MTTPELQDSLSQSMTKLAQTALQVKAERDRLLVTNAELLVALVEAEKHLKGEQNVAAQMAYGFIRAAIQKAKP